MTRWTEADLPDLSGRTFVVTGANSGLGFETARALAARGARVVLTARDAGRGEAALFRIRAGQPDADASLGLVDLSDLGSVRRFAEGWEGPLDVLVNNAGIMMPPRGLSPQGHELQFATNHLGHFALTALLFPQIAGGAGRVVTVSSLMHRPGRIHWDDLTGTDTYSPTRFYSQSKFANVLFGLELQRRLDLAGVPVRSLLAHPGYAATNLQSSGPRGAFKRLMAVGNRLVAQSAAAGALPQLYAAASPDAQGGQFIGPDRLFENRGRPTVVQPARAAQDPVTATRLWELSEQLAGVTFRI